MINLESETIITINEAKKLKVFRVNGKSPDRSTVWRWIKNGAKAARGGRVKLETAKSTRGEVTTVQAVQRFVAAVRGTPAATAARVTPAKVDRSRRLAAVGLLDLRAGSQVTGVHA